MATDVAGKTALVTGARCGIGGAVALGLGAVGARVVFPARLADDDTGAIWDVSTAPAA